MKRGGGRRGKRIAIDLDVHRMIEQHRRSFSESEDDILRRILPGVPVPLPPAAPGEPPDDLAAPAPPAHPAAAPTAGSTRSRGQWTVEIQGERMPAANLKCAYRTLLETLSARHPGFLADFAEEGGRLRRFVARTPAQLYAASPHLAKRHAQPLASGWYFDSNLSAAQASRRARIAARICGLRYGSDVRILDNLREI